MMNTKNVRMIMENALKKEVKNTPELSHLAGKYLTFQLGEQEFGLEILKVREIIGYMKITSVPQAPDYLKGIINLRGEVIPIIELRLKFVMEEIQVTEHTCIIVLETRQNKKPVMTWIIVDNVSEVHDIPAEQIEGKDRLETFFDTNFILGMGKIENDLKILLDINKLIECSNIDHLLCKN